MGIRGKSLEKMISFESGTFIGLVQERELYPIPAYKAGRRTKVATFYYLNLKVLIPFPGIMLINYSHYQFFSAGDRSLKLRLHDAEFLSVNQKYKPLCLTGLQHK